MFVSIKKSTLPKYKYTAVFYDDNKKKIKTTHFGAKGMNDFTLTKDKEARDRYRKRHKKDLRTGDFKRAGYLSYYVLWGDSSNINTAIKDYMKRFNLKQYNI